MSAVITPILEMGKLRHRKVNNFFSVSYLERERQRFSLRQFKV